MDNGNICIIHASIAIYKQFIQLNTILIHKNTDLTTLSLIGVFVQARREPQRGPGNHYRRALSQPFRMRRDRGVKRDETWGGVSPHHPTRGLGERRKLPNGGPPRPKMDFVHIWRQKEAIWNTLFSIFERWRGPQTSRGPGKLPPFPPSRRACLWQLWWSKYGRLNQPSWLLGAL